MGLAKWPFVFVTVLLLAFIKVNSLQCYVCKNCTKVTSSQLTTCVIPSINITTTTSTTTSTTTEASSAANTTESASTTANTTESTSTTANSTESTSATANSTESTSATANSTESTSTTTNSTESISTTANSTESTSTTGNSTESTSTIANSTEATASNGTDELTVFRVKRLAETNNLEETAQGSECSCDDGYCNCGGEISVSPYVDLLENITVTFVCVTESVTSNSVTTVNRGCGVEFNTTANTCRLSGYDQSCNVCKKDGCNSAFMTTFSFLTIIPALIMSVV